MRLEAGWEGSTKSADKNLMVEKANLTAFAVRSLPSRASKQMARQTAARSLACSGGLA